MTKTSERMNEIKGLRAQVKARQQELKDLIAKAKAEANFLKEQETKLKAAEKAEREAIKKRAEEARAAKKAKKEQEAKEKAEAKANRTRGKRSKAKPRQDAPKSEKQKQEEGLAQTVARELMEEYGLNSNSTVKEIRDIRRAYAKKYHPDIVGGNGLRMQIANTMLDGAEKTAKWKAQRAEAA
jgi:hypothetical protein